LSAAKEQFMDRCRRVARVWVVGASSLALAALSAAQGHRVNGPLSRLSGGSVRDARISPDGLWAVYAADQEEVGVIEFYSVPLKGGAPPIHIGGPLEPDWGEWAISPDSRHVIYQTPDLYSVAIDRSSPPVRLIDPLVLGRSGAFAFDPAGGRVVLGAVLAGTHAGLYSVPVDGSSPPVTILASTPQGGPSGDFVISPDGETVVFSSLHEDGSSPRLYSAPTDGGGPVSLLHAPLAGNGNTMYALRLTPDGQRCVFVVRNMPSPIAELFSVAIAGGVPATKLNGSTVTDGNLQGFAVTPDSARVVFVSNEDSLEGTSSSASRSTAVHLRSRSRPSNRPAEASATGSASTPTDATCSTSPPRGWTTAPSSSRSPSTALRRPCGSMRRSLRRSPSAGSASSRTAAMSCTSPADGCRSSST